MSYTPGPWGYDETTLSICRLIVTVEDVQTFQVSPDANHSHAVAYIPCDVQRVEQEANARLITAAPELLAALKSMVQDDDRLYYGRQPNPDTHGARAAIAKAEGK